MTIQRLHYHEHVESCAKCMWAREEADVMSMLLGNDKEVNKLYNNSCEVGKEILANFWLNYKAEN